jgi:hypothetical protein
MQSDRHVNKSLLWGAYQTLKNTKYNFNRITIQVQNGLGRNFTSIKVQQQPQFMQQDMVAVPVLFKLYFNG